MSYGKAATTFPDIASGIGTDPGNAGMSEQVAVSIANGVNTLRIDRPDKQNALTSTMYDIMSDAFAFGESSSRVRCFLLMGAPGVFTAGNDVHELQRFAEEGALGESAIHFLKTIASLDKPLLAAVDGLAVGIGTTLLFHCDYVIASEWSTFSAPFADLGLTPEAGSSILAPRLMGHQRAFELLVMGEPFDAERAFQAGIVNKVVPAEELETAAEAAALAVAAKPPEAVRTALKLMRGERRDIAHRIDKEASSFTELLRSPAARDALQAFIDRRR
jgi:enoyl-CoA hydratase/carnithine racemase